MIPKNHLRRAAVPLLRAELRETLRTNNQRLGDALTVLQRDGVVEHNDRGWALRRARHVDA